MSPITLSPFRKKLWLIGGAIGMFFVTLAIAGMYVNSKQDAQGGRTFGHDFLGLYVAGTFAREGRVVENYNPDLQRSVATHIAEAANLDLKLNYGAWLYPPFVNLAFAPLASLDYGMALGVWTIVGLVFAGASMIVLCRMFPPGADWKTWGLVPLLMATSMPFILTLGHGQNTFVSLLLLTLTVAAWRRGQSLLAGLACGMMFYKPQLGAIVGLVLVIHQGRRAFLGVAMSGAALLAICVVGTPGALEEYLTTVPGQVRWMQENGFFPWARHVTAIAFWRRSLQGTAGGATAMLPQLLGTITALAFGVGVIVAAIRSRVSQIRERQEKSPISQPATDRLIAATIAAMPMIMPYFVDYDLLLLAIPAVLFAAERCRQKSLTITESSQEKWLVRGWIALYVCTMVGTIVAGHSRLSITPPIIGLVSGMLIFRAFKRSNVIASIPQPETIAPPLRQAA